MDKSTDRKLKGKPKSPQRALFLTTKPWRLLFCTRSQCHVWDYNRTIQWDEGRKRLMKQSGCVAYGERESRKKKRMKTMAAQKKEKKWSALIILTNNRLLTCDALICLTVKLVGTCENVAWMGEWMLRRCMREQWSEWHWIHACSYEDWRKCLAECACAWVCMSERASECTNNHEWSWITGDSLEGPRGPCMNLWQLTAGTESYGTGMYKLLTKLHQIQSAYHQTNNRPKTTGDLLHDSSSHSPSPPERHNTLSL